VTRTTGGAALVAALRQEGVRHVFGLIGTSLLEVLDVIHEDPDISYVGVRHEQNAVHMADAYARVTGRPGVVLACQPGPGATNLVTGLAQARLAYSPVVAVAGLPASGHLDTDVFQEIDQQALFGPVSKQVRTVHVAGRLPEYVHEAFRISLSGRNGPVVLNVPSDVLAADANSAGPAREAAAPAALPAPSASSAARAADLLNAAGRPLIIAGGGVAWARAGGALMELADRLNAPIVASAGHPDVVPNDYRLYAGQIGPRGNAVATGLARSADVILALGTRLGFNSTFYSHDNISATARIIQADVDPSAVGRYFPVEVGITADAGELIGALLPAVKQAAAREAWIGPFLADRQALLADRASTAAAIEGALTPLAVCLAAQRALPRETIVTLDTGTCCMQSTDVIQTFGGPGSFLAPLDFGLVGFAYPAGLGAKAAAPDRPVLTIVGDGGFGMSMGEIGTAIGAGLSTITLVMDNGAWGAEKAYQRDFYGGRYVGADLVNPAFDQVAAAFGAVGVRARTADDVTAAVAQALRDDAPTIVHVPVNPDQIISLRRDVFAHRSAGQAG
jgi:thiamine pyrophosphate-dependent acetolactate synthase large subunit-like protein